MMGMKASAPFVSAVAASLVAAAIVGWIQHFRSGGEAPSDVKRFEGWLDERHHPPADADLIDFVLANEGEKVILDLKLGPDIADEFAKISNAGVRTYSFALMAAPDVSPLMDLHLLVEPGDDFFFAVESPGTAVLRGRFRIVGCAQTGTGWFACKLQALPAEAN